jgi:hypothetical protein
MFELDTGSSGVGGPFLQWSARGTQDGSVAARSFYIRDGSDKKPYDGSKGMVLDIAKMKTGWQRSEGIAGVAPEWKLEPKRQPDDAQPRRRLEEGLQHSSRHRRWRHGNLGAGRHGSLASPGRSGTAAAAAAQPRSAADGQADRHEGHAVQARLNCQPCLDDREVGAAS